MGLSSISFRIAYCLQLPSFLRWFLKTFANNPPIVLFCHRILPPKSKFSRLDEFYHCLGYPTLEEFESQLRYLSRHHAVVSLEEVVDFIIDGKILPASPIALTFDDGYHDSFALAFPVLQDYQFKAAFFLTIDFISSGKIPYHDQIIYGLCYTKKKKVQLEGHNNRPHEFLLETLNERIKSFLDIQALFKDLPYGVRATFVKNLLALLEVEINEMFSRDFMMSWDEIKTMHSSGHTFYCHTRSHPLLTKLNANELKMEIVESNRILCEKLPVYGKIFCYPYGKKGEFNERIIHFLKDNGFIAACSAIHGINRQGDDPFNVKRTAMISEPIEKFSLRTAGLFEIIKELQSKWESK